MPKRKTNIEFVAEVMDFSEYGPLAQLFVIDALTAWSEKIMNSHPSEYPMNGIVNPEAWIGVAAEINQKIRDQYAPDID